MKFVYPEFLFAFAALAIPIIIHLFNFRKFKRIYFPDITFLKEVKEQTQSRSRLRHLIILLCRILAFSFLVLAFAQPFIPGSNADKVSGEKIISIYIDNSYSMEALAKNGPLLDIARQKAEEVVKQYGPTDNFQLVTNDFHGYEQRLYSREEIVEMINDVKASPVTRPISEVVSRQMEILGKYPEKSQRIILFSDFQKSTSDIGKINGKEMPKTIFLPLIPQYKGNVSIDSIWFLSPVHQLKGQEKITVRIRNHGNEPVENAQLKIEINKAQKALTSFNIDANSYVDSTLIFTNTSAGLQRGMISVTDPQLDFDNRFYFSYMVEPYLKVLCIVSRENTKDTANLDIRNIFRNDNFYRYKTVYAENTDYSTLGNYNLIVLNRVPRLGGLATEITEYIENGGSVFVIPPVRADLDSYNGFFQQNQVSRFNSLDTSRSKAARLNLDQGFFDNIFEKRPDNIDLPMVKKYYSSSSSTRSRETVIIRLQNGSSMLSHFKVKKGNLYVSYVPTDAEAGNFSQHALFVPVVLRIAELSQSQQRPYYSIGKDATFEIRNKGYSGENVFKVEEFGTANSFIPEYRNNGPVIDIFIHNEIKNAGNYDLVADKEVVTGIGLNYNRLESDLRTWATAEMEAEARNAGIKNFQFYDKAGEDIELNIEAIDNSKKYWKYCLLLALLFLALEVLLLRLWKV